MIVDLNSTSIQGTSEELQEERGEGEEGQRGLKRSFPNLQTVVVPLESLQFYGADYSSTFSKRTRRLSASGPPL